jgi:hypothetical protein
VRAQETLLGSRPHRVSNKSGCEAEEEETARNEEEGPEIERVEPRIQGVSNDAIRTMEHEAMFDDNARAEAKRGTQRES